MTTNINKKYIENNVGGANLTILQYLLDQKKRGVNEMFTNDIAEGVDIDQNCVSARLSQLVKRGLVRRIKHPGVATCIWKIRVSMPDRKKTRKRRATKKVAAKNRIVITPPISIEGNAKLVEVHAAITKSTESRKQNVSMVRSVVDMLDEGYISSANALKYINDHWEK
tara:strand:+ start:3460 stop:3963 length:504 start_codon:yes stop_codon:yes gene_type:complete